MNTYSCPSCKIAFEIGNWVGWDADRSYTQLVCTACGTMHRVEHPDHRPDVLYALDAPIRKMVDMEHQLGDGRLFHDRVIPYEVESWREIGPLETSRIVQQDRTCEGRMKSIHLDKISCCHCGATGRLVSLEWPLGKSGRTPVFGDSCPLCKQSLELVHCTTIN